MKKSFFQLVAALCLILPSQTMAIGMGDKAGAAELLQTALSAGDEAQREHAQSLLDSLE